MKKLSLKKSTLRVLTTTQLDGVHGGGTNDTNGCSGWTCSCESCKGTDCLTTNDPWAANDQNAGNLDYASNDGGGVNDGSYDGGYGEA